MIRLLVAGAAGVGLIAFLTLVVARLIRSRRQGLSVRMQVFLALASIVGAFALGLGLLVVDRVDARARRLALSAAEEEANAVATLLQNELARSGVSLDTLARQLNHRVSGRANWPHDSMQSMGLELLTPDHKVLFPRDRSSRAREPGAVFSDAQLWNDKRAIGIVRVVKPTIVVEALLADFAPFVLVISLVLGGASALCAVWIGRTIAAPIEELSVYSERVSQGERPQLPRHVSGREVGRLAQSIEVMRERLEGRPFVETFAADLSHELKNPVAAILASTEVLEEGALAEPVEAARFIKRIRQAATRIEKLLRELLSLAQVETRGPEHLALVAVDELVRQAVESVDAEGRIALELHAHVQVRGDELWLRRAITNLLDNALHHGQPDAPIEVHLTRIKQEVQIEVVNGGALDQHVTKSLFRRFVTTRRDQGGTGLGLSIVRAVAEAHGGHADLLAAGPPQVKFRIRLPVWGEIGPA